jgi:hypothetical protein
MFGEILFFIKIVAKLGALTAPFAQQKVNPANDL